MAVRRAGVCALLWFGSLALAAGQGTGWQLPANAADEKNPVAFTDATLANGRRLYRENCRRCHGPQGKGNGSDADPRLKPRMDLTSAARAELNPDGVVFHKIWRGREKPKMPAFREKLTREEVWTLVGFVQSLREKS